MPMFETIKNIIPTQIPTKLKILLTLTILILFLVGRITKRT